MLLPSNADAFSQAAQEEIKTEETPAAAEAAPATTEAAPAATEEPAKEEAKPVRIISL